MSYHYRSGEGREDGVVGCGFCRNDGLGDVTGVVTGPRSMSGMTDGGPVVNVGIVYERLRFLGFARNDIWGGAGDDGVWRVPAFAGITVT